MNFKIREIPYAEAKLTGSILLTPINFPHTAEYKLSVLSFGSEKGSKFAKLITFFRKKSKILVYKLRPLYSKIRTTNRNIYLVKLFINSDDRPLTL